MNQAPPATLLPETAVMKDAVIGRRTAYVLILFFVVFISIPAIHQCVVELRKTGRWRFLALFREVPTHDSLKRFDENLACESELAKQARMAYQTFLTQVLGQGTETVLIGHDGYLFFRQEVDMAAGPGFLSRKTMHKRGTGENVPVNKNMDAVSTIIDFHRQLCARHIRLLFAPLPVKPFIYPEKVWPGYPMSAGPAWNRDRAAFLNKLKAAGVEVVDVTEDLWKAKGENELYLKMDTHWSPRGLATVADRLAAPLRSVVAESPRIAFTTRHQTVSNCGDLLRMLEVLPGRQIFPPQTVEITQVLRQGEIAHGDDSAPVLLLGDSFANVYSRKELEWGEGAGLAEQLMLRLGVGVQVIALNGGGATLVRETLAQKPAALAHKKAVIWTCSARDLFDPAVSWDLVPLPLEAPNPHK